MLWRWWSRERNRQELGRIAEEHAARFLRSKGYRIVERNYRTRRGEIDLVAEHGETLVFVEVKSRQPSAVASPRQSVTHRKQRNLTSAAATYLAARERRERPTRFDVVEVAISQQGRVGKITLIEGAFRGR